MCLLQFDNDFDVSDEEKCEITAFEVVLLIRNKENHFERSDSLLILIQNSM